MALLLLGFGAGWAASGSGVLFERTADREVGAGSPVDTPRRAEVTPEELSLPPSDVGGTDIRDLPRYPGSVRTEYRRQELGGFVITESGYLASETLDPVREFYRSTFRAEGWSVADAAFSYEEWSFLVIKGEREARVELENRNGLTEIHVEASHPGAGAAPQREAPALAPGNDSEEFEDDELEDDDLYEGD